MKTKLQSVLTYTDIHAVRLVRIYFQAELGQILRWHKSVHLCALSPAEDLLHTV